MQTPRRGLIYPLKFVLPRTYALCADEKEKSVFLRGNFPRQWDVLRLLFMTFSGKLSNLHKTSEERCLVKNLRNNTHGEQAQTVKRSHCIACIARFPTVVKVLTMKVDVLLVTMNDYFQTSQTSIPSQWVVIIKPKMVDSSSTLFISPFFALTRLPKEEVESLSESWLTKQRIAARMDWLAERGCRKGG